MKKWYLSVWLLWLFFDMAGQFVPVSFDYDAGGNMTARYVVTMTSSMRRSAMERDSTGQMNAEKKENDVLSVSLGEQKIVIYPNPTSGSITVEINHLEGKPNVIQLYDITGRLLQTAVIQSVRTDLNIKGPAGVYLLDIRLNKNISRWKIIKE